MVATPTERRPTASLVGVVLLAAGCGGSAPEAAAPPAGPKKTITEALRYLPLKHDTVFSYDTWVESTGERGLLVMQVTRPREGRADLKIGNKVQRLELVPDGVRHVGGGYLLKTPLSNGAKWQGMSGAVTVIDVDRIAEVPAGKFVGCIETHEEAQTAEASTKVVSVYCPEVGLVSLSVEGARGADYDRESVVLKTFGPRVDIGALTQ